MTDDVHTYGSPDFDWSVLTVPTAAAMVRGQLGFSWLELSGRLGTLTQEDYAWEPGPDALRVVRREDARSPRVVGAGEWVAEWPAGPDSAQPRTVAWLVAHLTETFAERWDWTFGEHRFRPEALERSGDVTEGVALLRRWVDAWRRDVDALDDDAFFTVGLSTATDIDAAAPFGHLVLHLNRELVHHGAEICVLQDLHRARAA